MNANPKTCHHQHIPRTFAADLLKRMIPEGRSLSTTTVDIPDVGLALVRVTSLSHFIDIHQDACCYSHTMYIIAEKKKTKPIYLTKSATFGWTTKVWRFSSVVPRGFESSAPLHRIESLFLLASKRMKCFQLYLWVELIQKRINTNQSWYIYRTCQPQSYTFTPLSLSLVSLEQITPKFANIMSEHLQRIYLKPRTPVPWGPDFAQVKVSRLFFISNPRHHSSPNNQCWSITIT